MIRIPTIRSLLAGLMLALFALGITPKIAIHALVAHHTDRHLALNDTKADQLNKAGFHCATDNLVVELPLVDHSLSFQLDIRPSFPVQRPASLEEPVSFTHLLFGLRGPPAFC